MHPQGLGEPASADGFADLATVYQASYLPLVRLATLLIGSAATAEEIVQDCFVKLHHRWDKVAAPGPYLRMAVVNDCRSMWRHRNVVRRLMSAVAAPEPVLDRPRELFDALSVLSARERTAIVLRFYEDRTDDEIAAVLGTRPATVRSLVHRGLIKLRKVIEP